MSNTPVHRSFVFTGTTDEKVEAHLKVVQRDAEELRLMELRKTKKRSIFNL